MGNYIDRLKKKWKLKSGWDLFIVLLAFACTGFTVLFIKEPVIGFLTNDEPSIIFSVLYYVFILPIYNVILLFYGAIFGRFQFFWAFEKKTFKRILRIKD